MDLTDNIWSQLEGGYKVPFDASVPLRKLGNSVDPDETNKIWDELWNELHHQGDVGIASYLSVPQIVRIGKSKEYFNWNLLGLCCVIEQQRHLGNNPPLPVEYCDYYNKGLEELRLYVLDNIEREFDDRTYNIALATLATCSGRIRLGKAIMELEDKDIMQEFLKQF